MWISGGVSGAEHDRTVLKEGGLFEKLPKGEKGIADKGYINHRWADQIYCPIAPKNVNGVKTLTLGEDLYNTTLSSMRIEVERVFGRMKTFKVLTHSRDRNLLRHHCQHLQYLERNCPNQEE